jgi:HAMP domain-containing protein
MIKALPLRATIRTKLSLGYATAFALVVAVGVFGVFQLHSVNQLTREIREVWSPKIEALNKIRAALGEHRLLATRRTQTTNFRHLAEIAKGMQAMRATIDSETEAYAGRAERGIERSALLDLRSSWERYQDSYRTVEQRLEIGEITAAFAEFEQVSLAAYDEANEQLDILIAVARERSAAAEARGQSAFNFALNLTIVASIVAALAAWGASVWSSREVSLPIIRVSEAMQRLASGDHAVAIGAGSARQDEIGVLIAAVNGYRESLLRGRHFAALAEAERERLQAAVSNMPIGLAMFDAQRPPDRLQ